MIWNGTENVTYFVNAEDVTAATLPAKSLVKYQLTDGIVTSVDVLTKADLANAVAAYDGANTVVLGDKEFSLKDTVVLYVKEADASGRANGTIRLAGKDKEGNVINNVYAVIEQDAKGNDQLIALFVDVDNKVAAQAEKPETHTHTWTRVEAKAATCTEAGNKEYYHCTAAGCPDAAKKYSDEGTTELVGSEVIDATGHTMEYTYDTDSDPRTHSGKCSVCNGETVSNETCDTNGTDGVCSKCNTKA